MHYNFAYSTSKHAAILLKCWNIPIFEAWCVSHADERSLLWNQYRRYWQMLMWTNRRRSGRETTSYRRCCCLWSTAWTCSRSSDRPHLVDTCRPALTPSAISFIQKRTHFKIEIYILVMFCYLFLYCYLLLF